jgi:hypothetical protein
MIMILKINNQIVSDFQPVLVGNVDLTPFLPKSRKERKQYKKLAIWLWGVSGVMLANSHAFAASSTSMWVKMQPLWGTFQEIAMVVGGLALFVGILTFVFKRSLGKTIVVTALMVVAGCFLVPSAIMLMGIVGKMMNDVLVGVFSDMNLQNSVPVGK